MPLTNRQVLPVLNKILVAHWVKMAGPREQKLHEAITNMIYYCVFYFILLYGSLPFFITVCLFICVFNCYDSISGTWLAIWQTLVKEWQVYFRVLLPSINCWCDLTPHILPESQFPELWNGHIIISTLQELRAFKVIAWEITTQISWHRIGVQ